MMNQPDEDDHYAGGLRGLGRRRMAARAVLLFERLWPALWPALGVAGGFICIALLDLPRLLPAVLHSILLAAFAVVFVALLLRGVRHIAAPGQAEADRRLERASGMQHRPLAVLADRPSAPGAEVLWSAHVARAAAQIRRLRIGLPHPGLAARDRRALRGGLLVALTACAVIAGDEVPSRLARAFEPGFLPAAAAPATQRQAWITPPGYTGLPPVFLKPEGGPVSIPAGSHLTVSLTGGAGVAPGLTLDGKAQPFQALDADSFQADQDLAHGGLLAVHRDGRELAAWDLTVVADNAPVVSFPEPPGTARGGARVPQTRLPWEVSHQYGVVALQAELRLRDRPDAPALIVQIPLPGGAPKTARGVRVQDFTSHPWAGLPVIARLVARDAPGVVGTSADAAFELAERRFENPIAQELMAVRKMLTLRPDDRLSAVQELDRLSGIDDAWAHDAGGFLNLRAIASLLYRDPAPEAVDAAQSRMWLLALHLEEGATERTARALEQARQALREALDADKRGHKVDRAELDRRMKELQEALKQHLQALAEQARRDPSSDQFDPNARRMDANEMQKLAEQMREAGQQGKMDDAREKMAELDKMLQDLQNGRPEHGKMTEKERQQAQKRKRGQQQMTALQDMVKREGGILDHSQSRVPTASDDEPRRRLPFLPPSPDQLLPSSPDQGPPPASGEPDGQQQAADPAQAAQRRTDQRVQQALRRALGELMQQYGDLTGQVPPNLGDADAAMRETNQALGESRDQAAAGAAQRAIEALQKGARSMSQQMAQQFGQSGQEAGEDDGSGEQAGSGDDDSGDGQNGKDDYRHGNRWNGHGPADRRANDRRDPLGRPLNDNGRGQNPDSDLVQVPEQMEKARTRQIQDELRRRGAERSRPQEELDYIDRLLRQF